MIGYDKLGRKLDLIWSENVEQINRGYVVDQVNAYHDGEKVGYLKLGYIPKKNVKLFIPTIFHYAMAFYGWSGNSDAVFDDKTEQAKPITFDTVNAFENILRSYTGLSYQENSTLEILLKRFKKTYRYSALNKSYKDFKLFNVDKPHVEYSNVDVSNHNGIEYPSFGKGIGALMYSAAHHKLKEKNLKVYASGLQSQYATRLWKKFEDHGCVKIEDNRRYLSNIPTPDELFKK